MGKFEYVVPHIISRGPFQDAWETNAHRGRRSVYVRRKPVDDMIKQGDGLRTRAFNRFARSSFIAHWVLEVRSRDSEPGLAWEIKSTKETNWHLEYEFGTYPIAKSGEDNVKFTLDKLGTTVLTDKEIDNLAKKVLKDLQDKKYDIQTRAAIWQTKGLFKLLEKFAKEENKERWKQPFAKGRSASDYNLWFKNCQDFAINMAYGLCGNSLAKTWGLNFKFNWKPSAVALFQFQRFRLLPDRYTHDILSRAGRGDLVRGGRKAITSG